MARKRSNYEKLRAEFIIARAAKVQEKTPRLREIKNESEKQTRNIEIKRRRAGLPPLPRREKSQQEIPVATHDYNPKRRPR